MYRIKAGVKQDPERRWALPDRVFFACGACHILAYAFLERYPTSGFRAVWLKPKPGFSGNHIVVTNSDLAFDYHGYSRSGSLLAHTRQKARRWWPGWDVESIIDLPRDVLVCEAASRSYDGLWLREPEQFLHNALPRAHTFLAAFSAPHDGSAKQGQLQPRDTASWTSSRTSRA